MEHKEIKKNKKDYSDIRMSWFMQQHYSPEELQQLYEWEQIKGKMCNIVEVDEQWEAFHILDTKNTIDLVRMKEREQCLRWVDKHGYKTEDGETFIGD